MEDRDLPLSRRKFFAASAAAGLTLAGGEPAGADDGAEAPPLSRTRPAKLSRKGRRPLACLTTVYRPLSHAYHIAGRFVHGYALGGRLHVPRQYLHSLFVHQTPDNDLSKDLARDYGVKVTRSIEDALTAGGKLAVEGVLVVGEHGNYPLNDKGQLLYPRFEWMEGSPGSSGRSARAYPSSTTSTSPTPSTRPGRCSPAARSWASPSWPAPACRSSGGGRSWS